MKNHLKTLLIQTLKISSLTFCIAALLISVPSYSTVKEKTHKIKIGVQPGDVSVRGLLDKKLFWTGTIIANKGFMISYERLLYRYNKFFSIDLGTGIATWGCNNDSLYLFRIYPNFKFWLVNNNSFGLYLNVSAGAPTVLSKHYLDNRHLGSRFIFNDIIGLGIKIGKKHPVELAINFHHYSNGNLIKPNPGFDVPAIFSLSYSI